MTKEQKRQWLVRILMGAVLGALLLPAVSLWGNSMMVSSPTCGVERFITPAMLERFGGPSLALVVECGMCWLYPVVCFLCYLPMVFILINSSALFHCFMVSVPALAGMAVGWFIRQKVSKSGD